ncbi:MAG TPA: hypothetical protein VMR62_31805 [Bryobacteraceae bacterium]|jgi:hypothetical protein|nr:hypothetical protein [Bryobacteraceae bacterium]
MNKGQGFAVGAFMAAALLLRPAGPSITPATGTPEPGKNIAAPTEPMLPSRDGPWIASCNYWAPARLAETEKVGNPADFHASVDAKGEQIELRARVDETVGSQEAGCGRGQIERWGFPADGPVNVMALIATVPDPVHTHLSLSFDRTIDAILQAASDNDYVSSYYWLPWKNRGGGLKFAELQDDAEPGHGPERERQPGLIIFKLGSNVRPPFSYSNVIYLFLVSETPTQGIDGFQLQSAFFYEAQLHSALTAHGQEFTAGRSGVLGIIGPQFSGSAASLRAAIDVARKIPGLRATSLEVTGATTTPVPMGQLGPPDPSIRFMSFASDRNYDIDLLLKSLGNSGYGTERVAVLVEDDTAAGSAATDFPVRQESPANPVPAGDLAAA